MDKPTDVLHLEPSLLDEAIIVLPPDARESEPTILLAPDPVRLDAPIELRSVPAEWIGPSVPTLEAVPPAKNDDEQATHDHQVASASTDQLEPNSIGNSIYRSKRIVDLAILGASAVPAVLIALVAAVAIKMTSKGPILFRQARVGHCGKEFECLKFRTMVHGENPLIPDASRITSAGKWLRRFSLDELPQLVNVARGDMSMVGPRPMLPFQVSLCDENQRKRFSVRPGLTGWAQINGRNELSWGERIDLDVEYVERQCARFDTRIVLGTAQALASGAGVAGHDANDPFLVKSEPLVDDDVVIVAAADTAAARLEELDVAEIEVPA